MSLHSSSFLRIVHLYVCISFQDHWASVIAQLVKNPPAMQETLVRSLDWEDPLEKGQATHYSILGLFCGSASKESTCNAGDLALIPGFGRSPGEGKGYPLQYSHLENSMDCVVYGVAKSQTRISDLHFHFRITNCQYVQKTLLPLSKRQQNQHYFLR